MSDSAKDTHQSVHASAGEDQEIARTDQGAELAAVGMTVEEAKDATSVHCAYCGAWMGHFNFTDKARCWRCAQKPHAPEAGNPRTDCVENAVNPRCRYRGNGDPPQDCDYPECGCETTAAEARERAAFEAGWWAKDHYTAMFKEEAYTAYLQQSQEARVKELEGAGLTERSESSWLPIYSAPEGKEVLVWKEGSQSHVVGIRIDSRGGWVSAWSHESIESAGFEPTHWMPLPAPPKIGSGTE